MPALPALPSGARIVASGTLSFTIRSGETRTFDATIGSVNPPACPSLAWVAAWRATDPVAGAVVFADASRMDLGTGRWGTADMGCASVELRNAGSATVSGELLYNIASR